MRPNYICIYYIRTLARKSLPFKRCRAKVFLLKRSPAACALTLGEANLCVNYRKKFREKFMRLLFGEKRHFILYTGREKSLYPITARAPLYPYFIQMYIYIYIHSDTHARAEICSLRRAFNITALEQMANRGLNF